MRTSWAVLSFLLVIAGPVRLAADTTSVRLESVRLLPAGVNSSLALQTSTTVPYIAATAADARTLVIELVGVAADPRDLQFSDAAGMISRVVIDTMGGPAKRVVTRIRVSLWRPFRHRVRVSGNLVYVDFERRDSSETTQVVKQQPARKEPLARVGARSPKMPAAGVRPPIFPAKPAGIASERPATRAAPELELLSRLPALTEWLQHVPYPASGAHTPARAWIPVVLRDGAVIYSYGEYAELNGRIVFPLPLDDGEAPVVQPVSLLSSSIDRAATELAAGSVRAARYALTRGESDFALLSKEVAAILDAVPSQSDLGARVNLIEMARRRLVAWPPAHHWYRARDVMEAVETLDTILRQVRGPADTRRFDLDLVAQVNALPTGVTFRQPTLIDLLGNAMSLASLLDVTAERTALLRATAEAFERYRAELPPLWLATNSRIVAAMLRNESRTDVAYQDLTTNTIKRGLRAARDGDVDALFKLRSELIERDKRLGEKRPDMIAAATAALDAHFAVAAQTRLARDQRMLRLEALRAYANRVEPALRRFDEARAELQRMKQNSTHSDVARTQKIRDTADFVVRTLQASQPPEELAEAHNLLLAGGRLAGTAAAARFDALRLRSALGTEASAAVTTAITTFERGRLTLEMVVRSLTTP